MARARRKAGKAKREARPRGLRLPPHVRPVEVDVHVEVDPARGGGFRGEVEHRLELDRPVSRIELHAADLRVSRARLALRRAGAARQRSPCIPRRTSSS